MGNKVIRGYNKIREKKMKMTITFDIEKGVIRGMRLEKPHIPLKEYEEQLTERSRIWKYFGDLLGYDLTSRKLREVV